MIRSPILVLSQRASRSFPSLPPGPRSLALLSEGESLLSVWGQEIFFLIFSFFASIGVLLNGMVESSLLSEDGLLTLDIDGVMPI